MENFFLILSILLGFNILLLVFSCNKIKKNLGDQKHKNNKPSQAIKIILLDINYNRITKNNLR